MVPVASSAFGNRFSSDYTRVVSRYRCLWLVGVLLFATASAASGQDKSEKQDEPEKRDMTPLQLFRSTSGDETASGWFRWAIDGSVADSDTAELTLATDAHCSLYVNGQRVMKNATLENDGAVKAVGFEIMSLLRQGRNSIAIEVNSSDNTAEFHLSLLTRKGDASRVIGGPWKVAPAMPPVGWQQTDFNDRDWEEAKPVGGEPVARYAIKLPSRFVAPVIPAKSRPAPFQFEDGDRVVFVGATFLERAQLFEHLEATLTGTLGEKHVTFRNLGWSADTVFADSRGIFDRPDVGYLRMVEHIRAEEPTVAFICYGQNEALTSQMTPEKYAQQLGRLLDELEASGIVCVLVSPHELLPAMPPVPSPSRFNSGIRVYSEATGSVAQSRGLLFVDLFSGFSDELRRLSGEMYGTGASESSDWFSLSENGMHLTDAGYACAAVCFRDRLLGGRPDRQVVVDSDAKQIKSSTAEIRNVVWNPESSDEEFQTLVSFEVRENAVSAMPLIVTVKGSAGKTVERGNTTSADISEPLSQRDSSAARSEKTSEERSFAAGRDPQYELLRTAILQKNELYFHRWRPQNITYLFGFRKHEQGNNAADIAKFDPFIQDLEQQIHKLQPPGWRTVVLQLRK